MEPRSSLVHAGRTAELSLAQFHSKPLALFAARWKQIKEAAYCILVVPLNCHLLGQMTVATFIVATFIISGSAVVAWCSVSMAYVLGTLLLGLVHP
jgi:hypothetical protein